MCVYIFYSIPINWAHNTFLISFPYSLNQKRTLTFTMLLHGEPKLGWVTLPSNKTGCLLSASSDDGEDCGLGDPTH